MARTMVDIDDEALAGAARVLGTTTKKDTVNAALREAVVRLSRYDAIRDAQEMAARGEIDLDLLQDLHDAEKQALRRAKARAADREAQETEPDAPARKRGRTGRAAA